MSNLSALDLIAEGSKATPGLFNRVFSTISANINALNSDLTLNLPSGETFSLFTNLDVSRNIHAGQQIGIGTTPSAVTTAVMTIAANSSTSDYIHFEDSSAGKSNYGIGSRFGGTSDGLNLYDLSGDTMIVSFSKQSVRFFQNVVGPVFDTGGALADTYNAATFIGSGSSLSGIQAAINQAATDSVSRVYVPANMYPYDASLISFIHTIQMVREGGDWSVFDVQAYGANPVASASHVTQDTAAIQAAIEAAAVAQGEVFLPSGTYNVSGLTLRSEMGIRGAGWRSLLVQNGTTRHVLTSTDTNAEFIVVRDLHINGNNSGTSLDGIHFDNVNGGSGTLAFHRIVNVRVRDCTGHGIYFGAFMRNSIIERCSIYMNDGYGILGDGIGDSSIVNCDVGQSGLDGIRINQTGANRIEHTKCWLSGRVDSTGAGFAIRSCNLITLSSCYAQQNNGHGFNIFFPDSPNIGYGIVLSGCVADGDNVAASTFNGCQLSNTVNSRIDLAVVRTNVNLGQPVNAINVASTTSGCEITLLANGQSGNAVAGTGAKQNRISVNGRDAQVISPAQITANQNDYAPSGYYDAGVWRLTSDGTYNITGISSLFGGARIALINVGTSNLTLKTNNSGSVAASRFTFSTGTDITLTARGGHQMLWYDADSSRWRDLWA